MSLSKQDRNRLEQSADSVVVAIASSDNAKARDVLADLVLEIEKPD